MKKLFLYFILSGLFLFTGCKVEPEPINYGKDQCHFCKMNIVDKQHAAQSSTQQATGKAAAEPGFVLTRCRVGGFTGSDLSRCHSFKRSASAPGPGISILCSQTGATHRA